MLDICAQCLELSEFSGVRLQKKNSLATGQPSKAVSAAARPSPLYYCKTLSCTTTTSYLPSKCLGTGTFGRAYTA